MKMLHFWTLAVPPDLATWDPDAEPMRYPNGYGHAFLELYVRLRNEGYPVTIGPDIGTADVAVVALSEITKWRVSGSPHTMLTLCRALFKTRPGLAIIRNDVHLFIRSPRSATLEVMPTRAAIVRSPQEWLPLLPQRGLIPRDRTRPGLVQTVGLKANVSNIPDWVPALRDELQRINVTLRVDTASADFGWHDFASLDAVLCVHPRDYDMDLRKPATKLINAWIAGAIPLCAPSPGYLELGTPDKDCILISTTKDAVAAVQAINADVGKAQTLFTASMRRGDDFRLEASLPEWFRLLVSAPPASTAQILVDATASVAALAAGSTGRRFIDALMHRLARARPTSPPSRRPPDRRP